MSLVDKWGCTWEIRDYKLATVGDLEDQTWTLVEENMVFNWSIGGYLPFLSKVIRFACLIDLVSQHVFILASLAWLSDYLFTFSMIHSHLCLVKTLMVWYF